MTFWGAQPFHFAVSVADRNEGGVAKQREYDNDRPKQPTRSLAAFAHGDIIVGWVYVFSIPANCGL